MAAVGGKNKRKWRSSGTWSDGAETQGWQQENYMGQHDYSWLFIRKETLKILDDAVKKEQDRHFSLSSPRRWRPLHRLFPESIERSIGFSWVYVFIYLFLSLWWRVRVMPPPRYLNHPRKLSELLGKLCQMCEPGSRNFWEHGSPSTTPRRGGQVMPRGSSGCVGTLAAVSSSPPKKFPLKAGLAEDLIILLKANWRQDFLPPLEQISREFLNNFSRRENSLRIKGDLRLCWSEKY